jgi:site-specific DNA-methyltransferase (adenine-specific)
MFVDIYSTENKYSIIYADPPWKYQDRRCSGAAEHHYPTANIGMKAWAAAFYGLQNIQC